VDLSFTPSELAFREEVRAWLAANPSDTDPELFSHDLETRVAAGRRWQRRMCDAGWVGVGWPKEHGGRGATLTEEIVFHQEVARAGAPELVNVVGINMLGPLLIQYGRPDQKERFLPGILNGDDIWCLGMSEPGAGSDLASLKTRAVLDGDEFVISGEKIWSSYASYSSYCFLVVRTDAELPRHRGISCLALPMNTPGIQVRPLVQLHGDKEFCQLFFDEVRVPKDALIGELNRGWEVVLATLHHERTTYALSHQVVLKQYVTGMLEAARQAQQQGRSGISDPVTRQKIAQAMIEVDVLGHYSLKRIGDIQKRGLGAESSVDKLYWTEMNQRLQDTAMGILGPYSQVTEGEWAVADGRPIHAFLHSKADTIYSGTSEIQRNTIADLILGLPR
jgi:alkylation response protein AidB-like acyl-CoA dehydrogenase